MTWHNLLKYSIIGHNRSINTNCITIAEKRYFAWQNIFIYKKSHHWTATETYTYGSSLPKSPQPLQISLVYIIPPTVYIWENASDHNYANSWGWGQSGLDNLSKGMQSWRSIFTYKDKSDIMYMCGTTTLQTKLKQHNATSNSTNLQKKNTWCYIYICTKCKLAVVRWVVTRPKSNLNLKQSL